MEIQERDRLIATLLSEGHSLSDVQKILKDQHGLQLTYMDLRLITADLNVRWDKQDAAKISQKAKEAAVKGDATAPGAKGGLGGGRTVVSLSKVVRPGAVMSGTVTFKSGASAEWFVDAIGRLGLNPTKNSSKPTEDDLEDFQMELQNAIQGRR